MISSEMYFCEERLKLDDRKHTFASLKFRDGKAVSVAYSLDETTMAEFEENRADTELVDAASNSKEEDEERGPHGDIMS